MSYTIEIKLSAQKELRKISNVYFNKIINEIYALADNPRPTGCKKLKGSDNLYRIRISQYRVIYSIDDDVLYIEVIKIGHRKDIYD